MRHRLCALTTVLVFLSFSQFACPEAGFMDLEDLACKSDSIAVIQVLKSEKVGEPFDENLPQKGHWKYAQKNSFRFVELVKPRSGELPVKNGMHVLWAEESFICASARYAAGKYLVFLQNVGESEWVSMNFHMGGLVIDGEIGVRMRSRRQKKWKNWSKREECPLSISGGIDSRTHSNNWQT